MVARQVHNLKVVGSNPTSATNLKTNSDIISCRKDRIKLKTQIKMTTTTQELETNTTALPPIDWSGFDDICTAEELTAARRQLVRLDCWAASGPIRTEVYTARQWDNGDVDLSVVDHTSGESQLHDEYEWVDHILAVLDNADRKARVDG